MSDQPSESPESAENVDYPSTASANAEERPIIEIKADADLMDSTEFAENRRGRATIVYSETDEGERNQ